MARLRKKRGLSFDELGRRLNRHRPDIIAWEMGRAAPSPSKLVALAAVIEVDPSELTRTSPARAQLVDLRGWAGLTQAELARRAGLPRPTYALLERGRLVLRPEVAARLAEALGRDVDEVERAARRRQARRPRGGA